MQICGVFLAVVVGVKLSESEILRKQGGAVLQNTKRATEYGLKVKEGKRRVYTFDNQCLTSFLHYYCEN